MKDKKKHEIVRKILNKPLKKKEEKDLKDMLLKEKFTIDSDEYEEAKKTFKESVADKITETAGSWTFILSFASFLILWMVLNSTHIINVDPFPFILLNLILSCLAALQAPIIMMSQNRAAKKDSIRSLNDYKTDLKSELILEKIHEDIEKIKKDQVKIKKFLDSKKVSK